MMHSRTCEDHEQKTTMAALGGRMSETPQKSSVDHNMAKLIKQVHVEGVTSDERARSIEAEPRGSQSPKQSVTRPPRHTSSKYDFVKVRVWLGDNSDHYYVLSRFLVSRMLTVTKIPNHVAIKIALELKKLLIDNSLLDVSQSDLEANLFKLMERRGYGAEYINRYKMMTRFHHQRTPLIILVCGAACVGKSTIATQLAQRLNLPNVLQTDMVYELLRTVTEVPLFEMCRECRLAFSLREDGEVHYDELAESLKQGLHSAPLASLPVWAREFSTSEELITEFCRECRIVRKGLDGDLAKAMKDGKPVIIEGFHLDPALYLLEKDNGADAASPQKESDPDPSYLIGSEPEIANLSTIPPNSEQENSHALKAMVEDDFRDPGLGREMKIPSEAKTTRWNAGDEGKETDTEDEEQRKERGDGPHVKPPAKAIVVPIVLRMSDMDHQILLEEWIASRSVDATDPIEEEETLVTKFRIIQDYLSSFESQGLKVVDISATTFPQTLDGLHSYLLECIEQGCTPVPDVGNR